MRMIPSDTFVFSGMLSPLAAQTLWLPSSVLAWSWDFASGPAERAEPKSWALFFVCLFCFFFLNLLSGSLPERDVVLNNGHADSSVESNQCFL